MKVERRCTKYNEEGNTAVQQFEETPVALALLFYFRGETARNTCQNTKRSVPISRWQDLTFHDQSSTEVSPTNEVGKR